MLDKILMIIGKVIDGIVAIANFFGGKKAYIIGIAMIAVGIYQNDNKLILEGLSVMTLRAGIEKSKKNY